VGVITKTRLHCFIQFFSFSQEHGYLLKKNPLSQAPIAAKKRVSLKWIAVGQVVASISIRLRFSVEGKAVVEKLNICA